MGGTKVNWRPFVTGEPVTASMVCQMGTRIQIGGFQHSGTYELYVLATKPVKLVFWQGGYNCSPEIVSVYGDAKLYFANNEMDGDTVISDNTRVYHSPGDTEKVWIYAGIDGYYTNITYKFYWYNCEGGGSYYHGAGGTTPDFNGKYLDYTPHPTVSGEDTGHHDPNVESYVNDKEWVWASVNGYTLSDDGTLIAPEPIGPSQPDEPEPTTDPVSPSGTIVVRVTASAGNPYEPGGDSGIGQGNGTFTNPDDTIDGPSLPQIGIADGTLIAMFNPTQSELNELGDYLFDDSIWTQAMRSLYGQPMDYILSLGIVPVHPKITPNKVEFSLGPAPVANLSMWQITRQYDEVDCGEITIPEYWGGFLDYEPYTSIQIYLPYIGYRELNPSECLNKPIHVYYHIDLFTGSCIAFIEVGGNILYQFEGNCLVQLPITSVQHAQMMSGIISALGFGATLVATKGLGAFGGMAGDFMTWGAGASAISSIANAAKPSVMHGGNTSASYGIMGIQTPYCIIRRPRQAVATDQNAYSGFASWYRASDFMFTTGFTKVAEIHLDGLAATDWEIQEIERLLKNGVIF